MGNVFQIKAMEKSVLLTFCHYCFRCHCNADRSEVFYAPSSIVDVSEALIDSSLFCVILVKQKLVPVFAEKQGIKVKF